MKPDICPLKIQALVPYDWVKAVLFSMPPETSHHCSMRWLSMAYRARLTGPSQPLPGRKVELAGLTFPNPVGLAAGLDKNGAYIDSLGSLGFGFIEVGTVTPLPQAGNPAPRLFRLKNYKAIINRMGFNNLGVDHLVAQVRASKFYKQGGIIGINIGKNKDTPAENAADD